MNKSPEDKTNLIFAFIGALCVLIALTVVVVSIVNLEKIPEKSLSIVIAFGAIISMLVGIWFVFSRLKDKDQGFGPNSLKALGLVVFLPTLVLIAIQKDGLQMETLAALLGTVAGYVLSNSKNDDD